MRSIIGHFGILLSSIDPDTQEIIDRITITPPIETITRYNVLVLGLKRAGYWDRFDSLYVSKQAADQQAALLDWKRPVSGSINGSASWSSGDGFIGSSVAGSYVNSAFTPATDGVNYALNDCSMGAYIVARPTVTTGAYFGRTGGTANQAVYLTDDVSTGELGGKINSSAGGGTAHGAAAVGLNVLSRTASNAWRIDVNGVTALSDTDTSGGRSTSPIYLCAERQEAGDFVGNECNVKIGAWWAGDSFTLVEQAAIKSMFDTFFTI